MTTHAASLLHLTPLEAFPTPETAVASPESRDGQLDPYASEQIGGLIRRVFVPGWPRPARQVVFSSVEEQADTLTLCHRIAAELAGKVPEPVCIVQTDRQSQASKTFGGTPVNSGSVDEVRGGLRKFSRQISDRVWFVPAEVFFGQHTEGLSASWLGARLAELRLSFTYALLHTAPAGISSEAALLASLSDGIVLVLEAHRTRRAAARKVKEMILAANCRLIGTVLTERTFPIPEAIYRRL
jgi:protein-tyrosine kinase